MLTARQTQESIVERVVVGDISESADGVSSLSKRRKTEERDLPGRTRWRMSVRPVMRKISELHEGQGMENKKKECVAVPMNEYKRELMN